MEMCWWESFLSPLNHVPSGSSLFLVFIVLELILPEACVEPECTNYYEMTYCIYIVSLGHFIYVLTYCHKYELHISIHAVGTYLQHLSTVVQVQHVNGHSILSFVHICVGSMHGDVHRH